MDNINDYPSIQCPIDKAYDYPSYDLKWLEQLSNYLEQNIKTDSFRQFPIGSVDERGVLDCCKQGLGSVGTAKIAQHLGQNTFVHSILLGTNGLGDQGAKNIAQLAAKNQQLQTIYLGCNRIKGEGVAALTTALAQNPNIKGLWLKRNPIGKLGFRAIAKLLSIHNGLRTLDLVHTLPDLEDLSLLVDSMVDNQQIERLFLGGNYLNSEAAKELERLLSKNISLISLYLNVNNLGSQGLSELTKGLVKHHKLQELSLASNGITTEGFRDLFSALAACKQLTYLDIGYSTSTQTLGAKANQLGDRGAKYLADYLVQNKTLVELKINKNNITNKGLQYLIDALEQNQTVQRLIIGKGFHKKAKAKLQQHLKRNKALGLLPAFQPHQDVQVIRSVYR